MHYGILFILRLANCNEIEMGVGVGVGEGRSKREERRERGSIRKQIQQYLNRVRFDV